MVGNEIEIGYHAVIEPFMLMFEFHWGKKLCLPNKEVTNVEYRVDA